MSGEVRIIDPASGGEKGQKPAQLGTIDPAALLELARVGGFGASKYATYDYVRGFDWRLSYDAMQRHMLEFWNGEDRDSESGLLHPAHAAWHGLSLVTFVLRGRGQDTRINRFLENL